MRRLILSGLVVLGLAWAQTPYVGGYVALPPDLFTIGFHIAYPIQGNFFRDTFPSYLQGFFEAFFAVAQSVEVRAGVNFIQGSSLLPILGADVLLNLGAPGSVFLPYVGLGGDFIFLIPLPRATLGLKIPISGTPLTPFLEAQVGLLPPFALKVGANYGF